MGHGEKDGGLEKGLTKGDLGAVTAVEPEHLGREAHIENTIMEGDLGHKRH